MIFDIIVLAILLVSCVIAFLRGFIREVLTIAGAAGGAAAALAGGPHFSPVVRDWMGVTGETVAENADKADKAAEQSQKLFDLIPYTMVADALAYGGIFILVVIVLSIISHFLSKGARAIGLGALDRTFGVLFGIVRGALFIALLYLPVHMFVEKETRDEWFKNSRSHIYIESIAGWIEKFLPQDAAKEMQDEAGETARKKLQELDLLRPLDKKDGTQQVDPMEDNAGGDGYKPQQRENMQDLIREESNFND